MPELPASVETSVQLPPLLDYPNHLTRMAVLADGGRDAGFARVEKPSPLRSNACAAKSARLPLLEPH